MTFESKYPFFHENGIAEQHLSRNIKIVSLSGTASNGLFLDLFKYRKQKKLSWSDIYPIICVFLGTSSLTKEQYTTIQTKLHNLRKTERSFSKNKKQTELSSFLAESFSSTNKMTPKSTNHKQENESKIHNLQRQLRKRTAKLSEVEENLCNLEKRFKETEELLHSKDEEISQQSNKLTETRKKQVKL